MIEIPVSVGELVDKITILEIKHMAITDKKKLVNINKELEELIDILEISGYYLKIEELKDQLFIINHTLWYYEEQVRKGYDKHDGQKMEEYCVLAHNIHVYNDKRAKIKREINELTESQIVEEKSYD
jgi:hypothetical protein